jgi:hypothetical protein
MNQFANIGSMFPGAEFKHLRDNAKLALTLPGQHQIIGLVIKNVHGDLTIVEKDQVQVVRADQVENLKTATYIPKEPSDRDLMVIAGYLYEEYCKSVGGKAHDGQPLPNWATFILDTAKATQAKGWLDVAQRAVHILSHLAQPGDEEKFDAKMDLHVKFSNMLAAEVKRHGGIPQLSEEEQAFREAMAAFLESPHLDAKWLDPRCHDGCQSLVFKHEAERVLGIAQAEFAYWKKVCDEDPGGYGIEGMAAAANIVAAITMGISVEDFKAGKADYERVSEPAGNEPVERDALVPALKAVKHVLEALALSGPETHAHYRLMARRLLDEHVNPALAPKGGAQ